MPDGDTFTFHVTDELGGQHQPPPLLEALRGNQLTEVTWLREPWLMALCHDASEHIKRVLVPHMEHRFGACPEFRVFGVPVPLYFIASPGGLLTPILTVGHERAAHYPMKLFECAASTFNYKPMSPLVFDAAAFNAAFDALEPDAQGRCDVTWVVLEFDLILKRKGIRGAGIGHATSVDPDPRWDAMKKLAWTLGGLTSS